MLLISGRKLIRLIKVAPVVVIGTFVVLLSTIIIYNNHTKAESDLASLRNNFINQQKMVAKSQIEQVFQDIRFEKNQAEVTQLITDSLRSISFNGGRGYYFDRPLPLAVLSNKYLLTTYC